MCDLKPRDENIHTTDAETLEGMWHVTYKRRKDPTGECIFLGLTQ